MPTARVTEDLTELLVRTARGDRAAFEKPYVRTAPKLFGVALRICVNRELAKEAVQECYVTIWQKASHFDPAIASPISWMARIARNQAIDLRRLRAEQVSALSEPEDEANAMSLAPDPEVTASLRSALTSGSGASVGGIETSKVLWESSAPN